MNSLAERLAEVRHRIESAAAKSGRATSEIQLIVVTKNHSPNTVMSLFELGVRDFGENRDQEAAPKASAVQELVSASGSIDSPNWHFVGQLQSNKAKSVVEYASVLHSLDRSSLLKELSKQLERIGKSLDCFVQLNLTDNPDRGGVDIRDLVAFAEAAMSTKGINLLGLMAVADPNLSAEAEFARVLQARDRLLTVSPKADKLSIGMSGDFEEAIRFGATHLRIGSAITGSAGPTA